MQIHKASPDAWRRACPVVTGAGCKMSSTHCLAEYGRRRHHLSPAIQGKGTIIVKWWKSIQWDVSNDATLGPEGEPAWSNSGWCIAEPLKTANDARRQSILSVKEDATGEKGTERRGRTALIFDGYQKTLLEWVRTCFHIRGRAYAHNRRSERPDCFLNTII